MKAGRIAAIATGSLGALIAVALVGAGGTLAWAHITQRDATGYYTSSTAALTSAGYAIESNVDFGAATTEQDWVPASLLGTVRVRATSVHGSPVFVGIGPTADIDRWLAGVTYTHVTNVSFGPFEVTSEARTGPRRPTTPTSESFWVASSSGSGTRTVTWPIRGGQWSAVVMNSDANPGVAVDVNVGAKTGWLLPIGLGGAGLGVLLGAGSVLLILFGVRAPRPKPQTRPPVVPDRQEELVGS